MSELPSVRQAMTWRNTIITAACLSTGSPLAPVATHVIMHVAAVLHGMETTIQAPPHFGS